MTVTAKASAELGRATREEWLQVSNTQSTAAQARNRGGLAGRAPWAGAFSKPPLGLLGGKGNSAFAGAVPMSCLL